MHRIALASLLIALPLSAQERKLDRKNLPPAVEKTVQAETTGATIKGFATERENGKQVYEAETIVNGHTRDLQIATDGTLNEIEEEVPFDTLSPDVKSGLLARAAGSKINKVESLTKHGKLVAYEAVVLNGAHQREIQVGPNGGKLAHAE